MNGICTNCHELAYLRCTACKETWYCSAQCQSADWPQHKRGCKIQQELNKINDRMAQQAPEKPPKGRCTGCNTRWDKAEGFVAEDVCDTCGYRACESCASHHSNGTCYCEDSNFGRLYCEMEPRWYHTNGRGQAYRGDRHPEPYGEPFPEEAYEPEPRECNNCGEVTRMLKQEYL
ncbi:hypothetical protein B0H21DRAFT_706214 [Amylocystis lapponica]|nr:hypothetical protein B0H21DRAFT_706214 [Amylocystis lapponica]